MSALARTFTFVAGPWICAAASGAHVLAAPPASGGATTGALHIGTDVPLVCNAEILDHDDHLSLKVRCNTAHQLRLDHQGDHGSVALTCDGVQQTVHGTSDSALWQVSKPVVGTFPLDRSGTDIDAPLVTISIAQAR
ncbi:hypothetical protein EV663_10542 [Rhodovulum bhavnagarense]|uniref:Spore coat protein U-like protein n=2 Tax=Rhodovulum bhavnagarense TaxID=992286 RepID=A0A4R2RFB4_9RHOB|nr:hypothetical protein EV663_10542 [Rhodovulum bhavnagarense]